MAQSNNIMYPKVLYHMYVHILLLIHWLQIYVHTYYWWSGTGLTTIWGSISNFPE
jgi:hypothetical protein